MADADILHLLLVGEPRSEISAAAAIAHDHGADVEVADSPAAALDWLRENVAGLVMIDVALDAAGFLAALVAERIRVPVLACGIDAPAERAVAAIRAGARDYVPLPPDRAMIAAALACAATRPPPVMIGADPALSRALAFGEAMAASAVPVLIVGEPGTGKETVARLIHAASRRRGAFHAVECAGVADAVIDSELFGHAPGDFPEAVARRIGRLDLAQGGTLFVRDIDRLSPALQTRLVSVLRGVRDVRLVAASTGPLATLVAAGSFRADLAQRLGTAELRLPPLRERRGDLTALTGHLVARIAATESRDARPFRDDALALLAGHGWPGNVRELEDVVHRALVLARGSTIVPDDIVLADGSRIAPVPAADMTVASLVGRTVEEVERALILGTLERCRGNRTSASGILGISVRTMRNKLKAFIEAGIAVVPAA